MSVLRCKYINIIYRVGLSKNWGGANVWKIQGVQRKCTFLKKLLDKEVNILNFESGTAFEIM